MLEFKKILVDIDPTHEHQPALERAVQLVGDAPAEILLYTCMVQLFGSCESFARPKHVGASHRIYPEASGEPTGKMAEQHARPNITFKTLAEWHSPIYEGILDRANKYQPDLLVKNTHQHKSLAKFFFTPTDWQLLKSSAFPVLLVKNRQWPSDAKIFTALDPSHRLSKSSELDQRILDAGNDVAQRMKGSLHACHCFDPTGWEILLESGAVAGTWGDVFIADADTNAADVMQKLQQQHQEQLAAECKDIIKDSDNLHLISGMVEDALPEFLEDNNAGMLVLGTTYRTGLLGSTAEKLLDRVECDVLAIKPKGFESPVH